MKFWMKWKYIAVIVISAILVMTAAACGGKAADSDVIPEPVPPITDTTGNGTDTTDPITDDGDEDDDDSQPAEPVITEPETPAAPVVTETYYTGKSSVALVNLNMRSAPDASASIVTTLAAGTTNPLISKLSTGWYKVSHNGKERYISANPSYSTVIDNLDYRVKADKIIAEGMKLLATPYELGAPRLFMWNGKINPAFTGKTYDCSSFVQYIYYYGANVRLNADSRSQSTQGTEVSKSNMRKGDLLFMYSSARVNNTGIDRIGHVAMYIGNNQIMHTFGTGGVRIQDYSSFWSERTLKVMRVF